METSSMLPTEYKNRLPPPFSLIIRCYYVIEVCIYERDSSCSGLVQRSLIISSPLLHKSGDSPKTYSTRERNNSFYSSLFSFPPFPTSHLSRSSQSTRLGSLCCIATSHQLSILHKIVYICQ